MTFDTTWTDLFRDPLTSEVLIQGEDAVWMEKGGLLSRHFFSFPDPSDFKQFIEELADRGRLAFGLDHPIAEGSIDGIRVSLVHACLTGNGPVVSLRKPMEKWTTLQSFLQNGWSTSEALDLLTDVISRKRNVLVVGNTGSGKTTLLNALLRLMSEGERVLIIEDTPELVCPNKASLKFITRSALGSGLCELNQTDLVKAALRFRPDRIVMGEVRGAEAKDFLMALSTGHAGSMGSLHSSSAHQALVRLEMLVQMGAPQWSLDSIRKLIFGSVHCLVVVERKSTGERRLKEIQEISSLEESGFLLEPLYQS